MVSPENGAVFLAAPKACAPHSPARFNDSARAPLQGWRLSGSETCPNPRSALLSCLFLHLAADFTTFALKCSAPRSPPSFLPPGGTAIKLLQRDTHEEYDLRRGHLRRSPAGRGFGMRGTGLAERTSLSASRSPGPGWSGLSGDLASQRPPHLLRAQPRLSTRRAPTSAQAVTGLCPPAPAAPEAPKARAPTVSDSG